MQARARRQGRGDLEPAPAAADAQEQQEEVVGRNFTWSMLFVGSLVIFFYASLALTFLILLNVKLNGAAFGWTSVFAPVWACQSLFFILDLVITLTDRSQVFKMVYAMAHVLLTLVFALLVALKLDNNYSGPWGVVFVPILVELGLSLCCTTCVTAFFPSASPSPSIRVQIQVANRNQSGASAPAAEASDVENPQQADAIIPNEEESRTYTFSSSGKGRKSSSVCAILVVILLLVFLILKLDEKVDWSWGATLVPVFVLLGSALLGAVLSGLILAGKVCRCSFSCLGLLKGALCFLSYLAILGLFSLPMISLILLTVLLDKGAGSVSAVLWPLHVLFGLLVVGSLLVTCTSCILCLVRGLEIARLAASALRPGAILRNIAESRKEQAPIFFTAPAA